MRDFFIRSYKIQKKICWTTLQWDTILRDATSALTCEGLLISLSRPHHACLWQLSKSADANIVVLEKYLGNVRIVELQLQIYLCLL